jgi:putative cell wall-binding protein
MAVCRTLRSIMGRGVFGVAGLAVLLVFCLLTPESTGAATAASLTTTGPSGSFMLLAITESTLYSIVPSTDAVTAVYSASAGDTLAGAAVTSTGVVWVLESPETGSCISTVPGCLGTAVPVDVANGTVGQPVTAGLNPGAIAVSPDGQTLYVLNCPSTSTSQNPSVLACFNLTPGPVVTPIDVATAQAGTPITGFTAVFAENTCAGGVAGNERSLFDDMVVSPDGKTLYLGSTFGPDAVDLATGVVSQLTVGGGSSCPLTLSATASDLFTISQSSVYAQTYTSGTSGQVVSTIGGITTYDGQPNGIPIQAAAATPNPGHVLVEGSLTQVLASVDTSPFDGVAIQQLDPAAGTSATKKVTPDQVLDVGWAPAGLAVSPTGETAYAAAWHQPAGESPSSEVVPVTVATANQGAPIDVVQGTGNVDGQIRGLTGFTVPSGSSAACTQAPDLGNVAGFTWHPTTNASGNGTGENYAFTACTVSTTDHYEWTSASSGSYGGTGTFYDFAGFNLPAGEQPVTLTVESSTGAVLGMLTQTVDVVPVPILSMVEAGQYSPLKQRDVRTVLTDCDSLTPGTVTYVVTVDGVVGSTSTACSTAIDIDTPVGEQTVTLSITDSLDNVESTTLSLAVDPVVQFTLKVVAVATSDTLDGTNFVDVDACDSFGGTDFFLTVTQTGHPIDTPFGYTPVLGRDSQPTCFMPVVLSPSTSKPYTFTVDVTGASGMTGPFNSTLSKTQDDSPPTPSPFHGCTWNPFSKHSCEYQAFTSVGSFLFASVGGLVPRPPDYVVFEEGGGEGFEVTGGVTVTCDGTEFGTGGYGVTAGPLPISAAVGVGWFGSPWGPEPKNKTIDDFVDGATLNFSGSFVIGLQFSVNGNGVGEVVNLGIQAGGSVTYTGAVPFGDIFGTPDETASCDPSMLASLLLENGGGAPPPPSTAPSGLVTIGPSAVRVHSGEVISISGAGAAPDSVVIAYSGDPTLFASTLANSQGDFTLVGTVPSLPAGTYTIEVGGTAPGGGLLDEDQTIQISTSSPPGRTPAPVTSSPPPASATAATTRVYGETADATAAAEFTRAFPPTTDSCPGSRAAILATTREYDDALSSQFLAQSLTTGTLLTPTESLSTVTASSLKVEGIKTVYVVGGPLAIATTVVKGIENLTAYGCGGKNPTGKVTVTRIFGETQYGTAAAIAARVGAAASKTFPRAYDTTNATGGTGRYNDTGGNGGSPPSVSSEPTAILASGTEFQDAQAASVISYHTKLPLLLTPATTLSATAVTAIKKLGVKQVILLGGPLAVTDTVEAALVARTGVSVLRVAGKNYSDTACELARFEVAGPTTGLGWTPGHRIMVSRGDGFTDGIAGAVLDTLQNGATGAPGTVRPLLLTESPTTVGSYLTTLLKVAGRTGIDKMTTRTITALTVLGGPFAVSTAAVAAMSTDLSH